MNLDINSNVAGMEILHEGNHSNFGNPHNQYVSKNDFIKIPTTLDLNYSYYKFAKIDISSDDTVVFLNFNIINANNNSIEEVKMANITCKINSSGAITSATRSVRLKEISSTNFDTNNIFVIVTQSTSTNYTVELWFKQISTYKDYRLQIITDYNSKNKSGVSVDYYSDGSHVQTYSTGTIVNIEKKIERMLYQIPAQATANTYCKLFDIKLFKNYTSKSCIFEIITSYSDEEPFYIRALAKIKCGDLANTSVGTVGNITILDNTKPAGRANLVAKITKADTEGVTLSVYLTSTYVRANENFDFNITNQSVEENLWSIKSQIVVPTTFAWISDVTGTSCTITSKTVSYFGEDCSITRKAPYTLGTTSTLVVGTTGKFGASYLVLGTYYLWIDANEKLRIKNGVPYSDTDGAIVGV